jgi:hypothetical protein
MKLTLERSRKLVLLAVNEASDQKSSSLLQCSTTMQTVHGELVKPPGMQ